MLDTQSLNLGMSKPVRVAPAYPLLGAHVEKFERLIERDIVERFPVWQQREPKIQSYFASLFGGMPSLVIRAEFLSTKGDKEDLVGIGLDAAGIGIAHMLNVPIASLLATELRGRGISCLGLHTSKATASELVDLRAFMEVLQSNKISVTEVLDLDKTPSDCAAWIHAPYAELPDSPRIKSSLERAVFGPVEYAQDRTCLLNVNALPLTDFTSLESLEGCYPLGFVIRKKLGPEIKVLRCLPDEPTKERDLKVWHETRRQVIEMLSSPLKSEFIVIPFRKVHEITMRKQKRREHTTLFFLRLRDKYRLVGGYGVSVRSGPVELNEHAIIRPVHAMCGK
ncbi:MAG: hypothetical protein JWN64_694 [Parcubacteria group bacterium]|nr:hypothetical protein [Parcubacteria group bacterium]